MHVFDFVEKAEYVAIARYGFAGVYAGPEFAHWLIDRKLLTEVLDENVSSGDLSFYFDQGQFRHAAMLLARDRVISKWGIGQLVEHGLFEVPDSYGSEVRFFLRLPYELVSNHFARFAEEHGMTLESAGR
jgi:hypothetical protein